MKVPVTETPPKTPVFTSERRLKTECDSECAQQVDVYIAFTVTKSPYDWCLFVARCGPCFRIPLICFSRKFRLRFALFKTLFQIRRIS